MANNDNTPLPDDTPAWQLEALEKVKANKRARYVVEHIIKNGQITTEELQNDYGYNHPPRAARDVRERGVYLKTVNVKSKDGSKNISAYVLMPPEEIEEQKKHGRVQFSKDFKTLLLENAGGRCAVCGNHYEDRYLQIDHRIPYEIGGEIDDPEEHPETVMLLCGSCNRAKSWSCEHCANREMKNKTTCSFCYWASPDYYEHIATSPIRRLEIVWQGNEVKAYDIIKKKADEWKLSVQDYIKRTVK